MNERSLAIDALRGIAALAVVIYHSREINWIGLSSLWQQHGFSAHPNALLGYASAPFSFGFIAVPLFFVISGYCIHRPNVYRLTKDPHHSIPLKDYFKRRLWRVYPVLVAALLLTLLFDSYTRAHTPEDYRLGDNSWQSFVLNLLSLQNIACPPYGSNGPLWTLGWNCIFTSCILCCSWLPKNGEHIKPCWAFYASAYFPSPAFGPMTAKLIFSQPIGLPGSQAFTLPSAKRVEADCAFPTLSSVASCS